MDRHDDVAKHVCTDIIQNGIRQQRYRLKKAYWEKVQHLTPEQAYLMKPTNVDDESWKRLVNNWFDEHYQVNKLFLSIIQSAFNYILSTLLTYV